MGALLTRIGETPDLIVTSPAIRAESTAELARDAGAWDVELIVDERVYGGGPSELLAAACEHGAAHGRVMVVGHEPAMSSLVRLLTGGSVAMRTAAVAVLDLDDPARHGTLYALLQPRLFERLSR